MANYRGVKLYKAIDNSWNYAELWPPTVQRLYSTFKKNHPDNTTLSALQKQVKSKIKGWEAGIYERTANVEMSRAVGVRVGLSPESNTFCFFSRLTSRGLKQPINKNRSPGERLEEHKQLHDYRPIFLALHFALVLALCARSCIALEPTNVPVLQASLKTEIREFV